MTDESDIQALEQILTYASQEAERLRVSGVVLECLRRAADELTRTDGDSPTILPSDSSCH
jgi:hypothetical protein